MNYQQTEPNPATLPSCASGSNGDQSAFGDDFIRAATGSSDLTDMESCLEDTKTWLDGDAGDVNLGLYTLYSECNRVQNDCTKDVASCDLLQGQFQDQRALYAEESNLRCSGLRTCLEGESHDCEVECPLIKIRADAREADNETGERLVCLLENLFGELLEEKVVTDDYPNGTWFGPQPDAQARIDGLASCKDNTYDTSAWQIDCECPVEQEMEGSGYTCPTPDVSQPCPNTAAFATEMGWDTVVTGPDADCSADAQRGAQGVVDAIQCASA